MLETKRSVAAFAKWKMTRPKIFNKNLQDLLAGTVCFVFAVFDLQVLLFVKMKDIQRVFSGDSINMSTFFANWGVHV